MAAVPSIGRAADVEPGALAASSVALESLYERQSQRVFRFCLGYLRKRDEAEDATQTTFLHALRALQRGVVPRSESAWLLKIARNVCLTRFDSVKRRGNLELIQDPHVLAETASAKPGGDMDLIGLQAALERLPQRQRQAILLREWQGLSYAEIAEELDLTTSAVETLLFRARRSLARELSGEERRRGLDLAALLGWGKGLLGGAAAKIAVGAAVVGTIGIAAPFAVERRHSSPLPAREPLAWPADQQPPQAAPASAAIAPKDSRPPLRAAHVGGRTAATSVKAPARPRSAPPAVPAPVPAPAPDPHGRVAPSTPPAANDSPPSVPGSKPAAPAASHLPPVAIPPLPDVAPILPTATPTVPDVTSAVPDVTTTVTNAVPTLPDPTQFLPAPPPSAPVPAVAVPSVPAPPSPPPAVTTPAVPKLPPAATPPGLPKLP